MRVGSGLAVSGHPDQDDAAVAFAQHVVTQAPFLERSRPEVLDDDVGFLDQFEEQLPAAGDPKVERDRLLVARVHSPEEMMTVQFGLTPGAQRIRRPRRLDLDDLGAHVAEQAAGERSGDQGADLEDPDPVERTGRRRRRAHCGLANWCRTSQSVTIPTASRSLSRWSAPA